MNEEDFVGKFCAVFTRVEVNGRTKLFLYRGIIEEINNREIIMDDIKEGKIYLNRAIVDKIIRFDNKGRISFRKK